MAVQMTTAMTTKVTLRCQHPPKRKRIPEEHRFDLTQDKYAAHDQNA